MHKALLGYISLSIAAIAMFWGALPACFAVEMGDSNAVGRAFAFWGVSAMGSGVSDIIFFEDKPGGHIIAGIGWFFIATGVLILAVAWSV